ncbi:hypothetical protein D3C71_883190 [compost metagenome]
MSGSNQLFGDFALDARNICLQRHFDAETAAIFARADTDGCRHSRVFRNLYLFLAGDKFQRAQEAGGITGCEKLFRIGATGAIAAQFLRNGQRNVENAVFRLGVAGAATGGRCFGRVENGHDIYSFGLVLSSYSEQLNCAQYNFAH